MVVKQLQKSSFVIERTEKSPSKVYRFSPYNRLALEELSRYTSIAEIQELVQELANVDSVKRVRAVTPRAEDIHRVEFEVELKPETDLSDESWEKIQDLVIDCEWGLRDTTREKWYFHAEIVEKFAKVKEGAKVISVSYIQPSEYLKTKWSITSFESKIDAQ